VCRRTCGTFGRTAAAEGQYALRSGHSLRNFSEQELVDCQWQQRGLPVPPGITAGDPLVWMDDKGFLSSEDYPYLTGGPECVVYNYTYNNTCHSCSWKASEVITGSSGKWTGIASATGEDQMAAFVRHNGPIWIGINSRVFGLRDNVTNQVLACNGTQTGGGGTPDNCFITKAMCTDGRVSKQIDHAVTVVGYGADEQHGPYWQIKNSWSQKFGNAGFIKVARGIECAGISSGNTNTYGDMADYRCPHKC
jgi:cathepsin L